MQVNENGLPTKRVDKLRRLVTHNVGVLRTLFFGSPTNVERLCINRLDDANTICVCLQDCLHIQRARYANFVFLLATDDKAYFNPAAAQACASLLVPNPAQIVFILHVSLFR